MSSAMTLWIFFFFYFLSSSSLSVYSAPLSNEVTSDDLPQERECVYQLKRYAHGAAIETEEACLNCTCNRGVLVCFLRVCHNLIAPPTSGCRVVKPQGKCCSELFCGEEEEVTTLKPTPEANNTTIVTVQLSTTAKPPIVEDDFEQWSSSVYHTTTSSSADHDDLLQSGCKLNGSVYAKGSAMPSDTFCEYCYCIRGQQRCIRPQCHLNIDDCQPVYKQDFTCCPSAYNCSKHEPDVVSTTTTPHPPLKARGSFCDVNGTIYEDGQAVVNEDVCQHCFCVQSNVRCSEKQCGIRLKGCEPIVQPGKCCPTGYNCSNVVVERSDESPDEDLTTEMLETSVEYEVTSTESPFGRRELNQDGTELVITTDFEPSTELATNDENYTSSTSGADDVVDGYSTSDADNTVATTDIAYFTERADNFIDDTSTPEAKDNLERQLDITTTEFISEEDENNSTTSQPVTDDDDDYPSSSEIVVSTYWPEIPEEADHVTGRSANDIESSSGANYEEVSSTAAPDQPLELLQNATEDTPQALSLVNVTDEEVTYRKSSEDDEHNITVQFAENVNKLLAGNGGNGTIDDHLLATKTVYDGNNNFSDWTHVDNETDLLETSDVHRPTLNSSANNNNGSSSSTDDLISSSASLHGSLHSIVSSLLAKQEATTEGSHNYSDFFENFIYEGLDQFNYQPVNYLNFSDEFPSDVSTPASHRQDFGPTTVRINDTTLFVTSEADETTINSETDDTSVNKTLNFVVEGDSSIEETKNVSTEHHQTFNVSTPNFDVPEANLTTIESGQNSTDDALESKNNVSNDTQSEISYHDTTIDTPQATEALVFPYTTEADVDVELTTEREEEIDHAPSANFSFVNIVVPEEEIATTETATSESELEDTIEMILNLSKVFAAANKRPTQWHPPENSSAPDLLSGTLPADVEAKITEIIRLAQAGLLPTDEPFAVPDLQQFTESYNEPTSTTPSHEDPEYYDDYYEEEAKEESLLLDQFSNSSTTAAVATTSQLPPTDGFVTNLHQILTPQVVHQEETTTTTTITPSEVTISTTLAPRSNHLVTTPEPSKLHSTTSQVPIAVDVENTVFQTEPQLEHVPTEASDKIDYLSDGVVTQQQQQQQHEEHQPQADVHSAADEQHHLFGNNQDFAPELSELGADQLSAGSSIHQDEQLFGEAGAVFDEPFETFHQPDDDGGPQFDGLAGAETNEEKSYFSSDDNNFENKPQEVIEASQSSNVYHQFSDSVATAPVTPDQVVVGNGHHGETTSTVHNSIITEKLPELHPESIRDLIDEVKEKSDARDEITELPVASVNTVTAQPPATVTEVTHSVDELIDELFGKNSPRTTSEPNVPSSNLPEQRTEVVTNPSFIGLVTKGSIQFEHVLPLSRRGRPTTDEKTGQALPTPRKSNSSVQSNQTTSHANVGFPGDDGTPAVIPFLPEDAITDEQILKEQLFGGGSINSGVEHQPVTYTRPITIDHIMNNRTNFELHVNASTAINVHSPVSVVSFEPEVEIEGVAIPESHDYPEETLPVEAAATTSVTLDKTSRPLLDIVTTTTTAAITTPTTTTTTMDEEEEEEKHPIESKTTPQPITMMASAGPKFDDYAHHNSPSALGLQQTPKYCVENGEVFQDGERIPTHDFCAQCRCVKGEIQCQHVSCRQKPAGCIEKIVPSSCCPAFVCNETDGADVPIKSGITIHSGFVPIEGPVHSTDETTIEPGHHPSTNNPGHHVAEDQSTTSRPSLTPSEEPGIFGSLLEAVFGHGSNPPQHHGEEQSAIGGAHELPAIAAVEEKVGIDDETTTAVPATTVTVTRTSPMTTTTTTTTTPLPPPPSPPKTKQTGGGDALQWPMLKVSSCNIYGRVYQLGATIGVLSGPCKECKCTNTGVDCYKVKCF